MYSIKATAVLTGIGAETLRAWERRYQAIIPGRDASGRRFYTQQNLDKLLLLANLTRQGHAISKLSGLTVEQLQKVLETAEKNPDIQLEFVERIVEALLDYRIERCEQLLKRAMMANEPLAYVRDILSPALKHVGQLWHDEKLNIAQEHMFSACVKRILLGLVNNLYALSGNGPAMLFATLSGEPHEFGILMCSLLAAEQHYNCYYLGPNLPVADMLVAARKLKVEIIVLSLVQCPPDDKTIADLNCLAEKVSEDKIDIWLGGKGAENWSIQQQIRPKNCATITDLDEFYAKAQQRRYVGKN